MAKLVYGEADTDNVGLSMRCRAGTGAIALILPLDEKVGEGREQGARWKTRLLVASGEFERHYSAEAEQTEVEPLATAEARTYDAGLRAFATTGRISVENFTQDAETAVERAAIRRFMAYCAAG